MRMASICRVNPFPFFPPSVRPSVLVPHLGACQGPGLVLGSLRKSQAETHAHAMLRVVCLHLLVWSGGSYH